MLALSQLKFKRIWAELVKVRLKVGRKQEQSPEMTTTTILEDYTRDDVRREVLIWADRDLSVPQFYEWLPYCLIPNPKALYALRDVQKFLFIANQLKRVRNLDIAKQKLVHRLQTYPQEFES